MTWGELEVLIANFMLLSVPVDGETRRWAKVRRKLGKIIDLAVADVWKE